MESNRQDRERALILLREKAIRSARVDFWDYCRLDAADFYTNEKWHLKVYCYTLQALYERRLTKEVFIDICIRYAPEWFNNVFEFDKMQPNYVYTKLMINMPPRMGKSRTLVNFCKWTLGQDIKFKIMTCSYNDDMAQEFSRYTRDGIDQEKFYPHEIVFNDIFPNTKIKQGDASYKKWALEGNFFNYIGAGVGGSITGKGGDVAIVDDPVKDAEAAFNENHLSKIWLWYTGTFKSRLEERNGQPGLEIVNHTRWSEYDICGRILADEVEAAEWFQLRLEAYYEKPKQLLCPELLSMNRYQSLKRTVDEVIFYANYHQRETNKKGRLYTTLKTYEDLPKDDEGNPLFESILNYTDTADQGSDFLASIVAGLYQGQFYILDVLYTRDGMEITEPATAKLLYENNATNVTIESNNGGRGFARNVQRIIWEKYQTKRIAINWMHQSKNKKARILSNATNIMNNVYFPVDWRNRWPEFYNAMVGYQREGKNKNDDAPDALTGLVETQNKQPRARTL